MHRAILEMGVLAQRPGRLHAVALGAAEEQRACTWTGRTEDLRCSAAAGNLPTAFKPWMSRAPARCRDFASKTLVRRACSRSTRKGFELDVLRGATALLPAIHTVVAEVHFDKPQAYAPWQIVEFLRPFGFRLVDMLDHHVRGGYVVCADFVFERIEGV